MDGLPGASVVNGSVWLIGTNDGLYIMHRADGTESGNGSEGGIIFVTSAYQTPYMKGDRTAAYPLNDVNDRSGNGKTLTNINGVTFTSGRFGNAATFVAASSQRLERTGDASLNVDNTCTISLMLKTSTVPGVDAGVVFVNDGQSSNQNYLRVTINVSGYVQLVYRSTNVTRFVITTTFSIADGTGIISLLWWTKVGKSTASI